ncbi:MAG: phosphoglycolate phosphatase [Luteimonas sp.]
MEFPYLLVLFDLDGTLVDSASDISEAVNRTLAQWSLPTQREDTIRGWIGDGARKLVEDAFRHAGGTVSIDEVMPGFMVHYGDCLLLHARLYPGVLETLQGLRAQGVAMALCTNKPQRFLRPLLDAMGITDYFDAMVGGDTLPERKPSAAPLLYLAAQFNRSVDECLMVGDSAADLHAAQAAKMPVALVRYGYRRNLDIENAGAVMVLDDLRELLR